MSDDELAQTLRLELAPIRDELTSVRRAVDAMQPQVAGIPLLHRAIETLRQESRPIERLVREVTEAATAPMTDPIHDNVATKTDLGEAKAELKADIALVRGEMREMESRIIIRLSALTVIVAGALFAALHAWPPPH
jgi:hypothetical protein